MCAKYLVLDDRDARFQKHELRARAFPTRGHIARAFKSSGYTPGRLNYELWVIVDEKANALMNMFKT
jgi:hypothetical protein